ncbi:MAG: protease complex subunit PrcB family protein [Pyrinomonadaceae bacterium]|nr:protease complex subunit PrcB family protein [Pyrinomonadaceae bacterium]
MLKPSIALFALLLAFDVAPLGSCGNNSNSGDDNKKGERPFNENGNVAAASPTPERAGNQNMGTEFKVLSGGNHSSIEGGGVVVARDAETYRELRALDANLPEQTAEFFKTNAVIAAFLGERNTGGYSVNVRRAEGGSVSVTASAPAKGGIVTQVITSPFKIVALPVGEGGRLEVSASDAFTAGMRLFKVTAGEFTMSGGIAGRSEQYGLGGTLRVGKLGKITTVEFALRSTGEGKARELKTIASGVASDVSSESGTRAAGEQKGFALANVDAGSLVDYPRSPLRATIQFNPNDKLMIMLQSQPSNVADGFMGTGKLEAVAATNSPGAPKGRSEQ